MTVDIEKLDRCADDVAASVMQYFETRQRFTGNEVVELSARMAIKTAIKELAVAISEEVKNVEQVSDKFSSEHTE